ncbi:uncharacterized protein LOC128263270 [Drosophila gunungcola]|uniref:Uncharacterized protein n=1 Tax=Drosophila gunungcola TaxID=103775 RepID=A0A9P9YT09_9MUSC|nr:uncharacterized protein LOC128263270 [Drosophila gunungcola]KAI8042610.1 hypothetical protein M5D96_003923 [Drosophila gunungcola]
MLSKKSDPTGDDSSTVIVQAENGFGNKTGAPPPIGWNIRDSGQLRNNEIPGYLTEIHLSHRQITNRFVELLNLFEDYTKVLDSEHENHAGGSTRLKRVLSEQLALKKEDENVELRASSATQLSDSTLKPTCEVSSQTSWSAVNQKQADTKDLEAKLAAVGGESAGPEREKPSKVLQHTIHIEVESVTSATDMQRAPLGQRMWHVLVQTGDAIAACASLIFENFIYFLFIVLCLWCLFLLICHYYSFLQTNVNQQTELKRDSVKGAQAKQL